MHTRHEILEIWLLDIEFYEDQNVPRLRACDGL